MPTRRLNRVLPLLVLLCGNACLLPLSRAAPDPPSPTVRPPGISSGTPATLPPAPTTAPAGPEQPLQLHRNIAGDSKPLLLSADMFCTWVERGQRVILMQGQVLIQQGVVRVRCEGAVAFVDLARLQHTSILHADIYAEEKVLLEDGRADRKGTRALVDLNTRGELKIFSQKKSVLQKPVTDAALYQRAVAEMNVPAMSGPIVPAKATEPARSPAPRGGTPAVQAPVRIPTVVPGATPRPMAPAPPSGYSPEAPPPSYTPPPPPPSSTPAPATSSYTPAPAPPSYTPPPAPPPPSVPGPPPSVVRGSGRELPADSESVSAKVTPAQRSGANSPAAPIPGPRLLQPAPGPEGPARQYSVAPRTGATFQLKSETLPGGEQASIFTGGVIIGVKTSEGADLIDIEADNALVWSHGGLTREMIENLHGQGQTTRELEFYFSGNVQIRQKSLTGERLLQADEIYLDASRNVAIARKAVLQLTRKNFQPLYIQADELKQLSADKFEAVRTTLFSSKLPSDPGLKVILSDAVIEEVRVPRTTIFGNPILDRDGKPVTEIERPIKGENARIELENVPIFYVPWYKGDAEHPLGPLETIRLGDNRVFGVEVGASLDMYNLLHLQKIPQSRWRLDLDYLSRRGPALGTDFDLVSPTFFGLPAKSTTFVRGYGIYDTGTDILGGGRGPADNHPDFRGRVSVHEDAQNLPNGFVFQGRLGAFSDHNYYEQYFKNEYDTGVNEETYLYIKQTQGSWAWTGLVEPRLRNYVTETESLPRADGYLIGASFFDLFSYNAHASAGYFQLRTSDVAEPPVSVTDRNTSTGRIDLTQEVSLPFYLGPVKVAPYALGDLTYYTETLNGNDDGRAYGGLGLRASMPLTRLYPDAKSFLFNVDGLMHKIVLTGNYLNARSSASYLRFPQLDRLNDDPSDQALRDIRPDLPLFNPANGLLLATSPLYDPQLYAIRRLVENRIDTLDSIQVAQLDIRQRLQTKRGFPGQEHIVDWMTLDVSASIFPEARRDNFNNTLGFLEYDYLWNVGDRTAVTSSGWIDPTDHGARVYTIGGFLDRPDRTTFYLGYRQIDPLQSKAVTGAVSYIFSPKYAMTGSSTYDFGTSQSLSNSLIFTRMGTDLNVGFGITYNALQGNFGVLFQILPNLLQGRTKGIGAGAGGASGFH